MYLEYFNVDIPIFNEHNNRNSVIPDHNNNNHINTCLIVQSVPLHNNTNFIDKNEYPLMTPAIKPERNERKVNDIKK